MIFGQGPVMDLKKILINQKKILLEIQKINDSLNISSSKDEKKMFLSQIEDLRKLLEKEADNAIKQIEGLKMVRPLHSRRTIPEKKQVLKKSEFKIKKTIDPKEFELSNIEKTTIKRLKVKEGKEDEKKSTEFVDRKPNNFVKIANRLFSNYSKKLAKKETFRNLERDLVKARLQFLPRSYISVIFLSTLIAFGVGIFAFLFFLFFDLTPIIPFIKFVEEGFAIRFLQTFWIMFFLPIATAVFLYFYPSMEKRSLEAKINQELPFATIHMSSISSSLVDPSKIFRIMITTKEYENLQKEFIKLMNELNVFGYDIINALRNVSFTTPSKKLGELFNGLATTITSGGNMPEFFEKRSQSLLFDYRLEREKYSKIAETFMDIYISVVIAAPMILMLLLMMMKISGLGVSLSTSMITLAMILGVTIINIVFLSFLHIRQPTG